MLHNTINFLQAFGIVMLAVMTLLVMLKAPRGKKATALVFAGMLVTLLFLRG